MSAAPALTLHMGGEATTAELVAAAIAGTVERDHAWQRMDAAELGSKAYYAASLAAERADRRFDNVRQALRARFIAFLGDAQPDAFLELVQ